MNKIAFVLLQADVAPTGGMEFSWVFLLGMLAVFYFFMILWNRFCDRICVGLRAKFCVSSKIRGSRNKISELIISFWKTFRLQSESAFNCKLQLLILMAKQRKRIGLKYQIAKLSISLKDVGLKKRGFAIHLANTSVESSRYNF